MNLLIILPILLIIISIVVLGFCISNIKKYRFAISLAWILVFVSVVSMHFYTIALNPIIRMLSLTLATLFSMKAVVTVESYKNQVMKLTVLQWIMFVVGWFGMKPKLFETFGQKALPFGNKLIVFGISRLVMGIFLLMIAKYLWSNADEMYLKIISVGLTLGSLSLMLHFGILNISASMWRFSGVDTRTLFRSPLVSMSLTEFWGRRWNLAFSEMTAIALYKPLKNNIGNSSAMVIAFIFSGILHEVAISLPVQTGYGLPLLYFFVQGMAMLIEKLMIKHAVTLFSHKIVRHMWVIFWLVVPLPILFHKAFLKAIIIPLLML